MRTNLFWWRKESLGPCPVTVTHCSASVSSSSTWYGITLPVSLAFLQSFSEQLFHFFQPFQHTMRRGHFCQLSLHPNPLCTPRKGTVSVLVSLLSRFQARREGLMAGRIIGNLLTSCILCLSIKDELPEVLGALRVSQL